VLAPFRAIVFPLVAFFYKLVGQKEKFAAYSKTGRYWFRYVSNMSTRRKLHGARIREIQSMRFHPNTTVLG
jgi:hypothetical protein